MKLYVYKMVDGVEKSWDDVDYKSECEVVAVFEGKDNQECEAKAADQYGDTDIYGWTYNGDIPMVAGKDDFAEMVRDWQADNTPEHDDLTIDSIDIDNGKWIAVAHDDKATYQLSDNDGNIKIDYLGTR